MSAKRTTRPAKRRRTGATAIAKKTLPTTKKTRHPVSAVRTSKSPRRSAAPRSDRRLDFIDAAARVLGLAIEPAWKGAVAANLDATRRLAGAFMEFPLPDAAYPAPIFAAYT